MEIKLNASFILVFNWLLLAWLILTLTLADTNTEISARNQNFFLLKPLLMYQPFLKSVHKTNPYANIKTKHTYINIHF